MKQEERNEEVRRAVLEALAARHPAALSVGQVHRRLVMGKVLDFAVEENEVEGALEFLSGLGGDVGARGDARPPNGLVKFHVERLGSTRYWSATSEGVLAYERR